RSGHVDDGLTLLTTAVAKLGDAGFAQHQTAFLGIMAESLARAGRRDAGRAAIDEALLRCERTEARWCMSELLRIRGEIALLDTSTDAVVAERELLKALDWARRQQALSWELRSATSLARLRRNQGRIAEARSLLAPGYGRFAEGFATADLKTAT